MRITVKSTGGGDYEPIPSGLHQAICFGVADLGTHHDEKYNKWTRKVLFSFEIPSLTVEIDGEDKPRIISQRFTASLHQKASMRSALESWRGRPFTDKELDGFDVSTIQGANAFLNIIHKPKQDGGTSAVIGAINPLPKGMEKAKAGSAPVNFSFETIPDDLVALPGLPDGLPQWAKDDIMASREWQELAVKIGHKGAPAAAGAEEDATSTDEEDEDDVPF